MSETVPPQVEADPDEITLLPSATRGMRREDIDLTSLSLPFVGTPPFTNNVKKNSQFSPVQKKAMQQHELGLRDVLLQSDPVAGATIDASSIRTYFTPIVERMSASRNATVASVVPTTACTASSGQNERRFLADRLHIETVVTSHDPKNINSSENTGIHECLLVARRRDERSNSTASDPPTRFVSLRKMPLTPAEALAAADAIANGDPGEWGNVTLWPAERVRDGDWSPVQWFDGNLAGIASALEAGEFAPAGSAYSLTNGGGRSLRSSHPGRLLPHRTRHRLGPDGRAVRGAFCQASSRRP